MTPDLIQHILARTLEPIEAWILDWKGLKSDQKAHLQKLLAPTGIPIDKTHRIRHEINLQPNGGK